MREGFFPESIEGGGGAGFEGAAHFQAVGLDEIERPKKSVESGENAEVFLCKLEFAFFEGGGIESVVDIAREGEYCGLGIFAVEGRLPLFKTFPVERGERFADLHEVH